MDLENNLGEIVLRLLTAIGCGFIIGLERFFAHKMAGPRTYSLVALGATTFVIISQLVASSFISLTNFDPLRVASQIIVGIGFIGAGMVIFKEQENKVMGLTTAGGIWVTAAIGIAIGFGFYKLAFLVTLLVVFVFVFIWFIENKLKGTKLYQELKRRKEEFIKES